MLKSKGKRRTKLWLRRYQSRNEVGYKMQNKQAKNKRSSKQNKSKMTDDVDDSDVDALRGLDIFLLLLDLHLRETMARKSSGVINIPLDLMVEILEKLPTKSLARFRCVSYQWESMINKFIVIDSIMTRRLNQPPRDPHFLFKRHWFQPRLDHIPHTILSYTYLYHQVTDEQQLYHEEIIEKEEGYLMGFQYARGLIGFCCSRNDQFRIHNLTTRQSLFLPVTRLPGSLFYLFGINTKSCVKHKTNMACLGSFSYWEMSQKSGGTVRLTFMISNMKSTQDHILV
ncbi:hypothetical protein YC2023_054615 [Brassica napus]